MSIRRRPIRKPIRRCKVPEFSGQEKSVALLKLAKRRQTESLPPHFNVADFHNGYYECDYVSPWSISAHNLNASLMLVGQDWSSSERLTLPVDEEQRRLGQTWGLPTNKNLRRLLESHLQLKFENTYATNLFPFIKCGSLNARIPTDHLRYCARHYTIPEIRIVAPAMVMCLGQRTFAAIRSELGLPTIPWVKAREPSGHTLIDEIEIYGTPHPGGFGIKNAGGPAKVDEIWARLAKRYFELMRSEQ
jgi:uracil-DNA glycosylase